MEEFKLKVDKYTELLPPRKAYAEPIYLIVEKQRAYLGNWLPWANLTKSPDDIRKFLKESALYNKGGQRFTTFIFHKGKIAGSIGFVKIDKENHKAEIGYWLKHELQGSGIISRSCAALITFAFKNFGLHRIEIKVHSQNTKSIAVPQRLGFVHEVTLREDTWMHGQFHSTELFSILKREWIELLKQKQKND